MNEYRHQSIKHNIGQFVDSMPHVNGIEFFWAMLNRGQQRIYHKMSRKHRHKYVFDIAGKYNFQRNDTNVQIQDMFVGMDGEWFMYNLPVFEPLMNFQDRGLASGEKINGGCLKA